MRQGCLLSLLLFLVAIAWTMKKAADGQRTGLQWTPFQQLEDLNFADDLALLSGSHTQMQSKTNRLYKYSKQLGLMINISKTKVMRINTKSDHAMNIEDQPVENVDEFLKTCLQNTATCMALFTALQKHQNPNF